jgi:ferrous iron transport protein A
MSPPPISAETVLSQVAVGQTALILGLQGGHAVSERLAEFGLLPSARVAVLRNSSHGPLLVAVQGARLALGRGEAAKVRVVIEPARTGRE